MSLPPPEKPPSKESTTEVPPEEQSSTEKSPSEESVPVPAAELKFPPEELCPQLRKYLKRRMIMWLPPIDS